MKKIAVFFNVLVAMSLLLSVLPAQAAPRGAGDNLPQAAVETTGAFFKVIVKPGVLPEQAGIALWHDYGAFALYRVSKTAFNNLSADTRSRLQFVEDTLSFENFTFDTQKGGLDGIPEAFRVYAPSGSALQAIQFVGPIKDEWLQSVRATGATLVHYLANYGYLVWADEPARASLTELVHQGNFMQFSAPYQTYFKLGRSIYQRLEKPAQPETVNVVIQVYVHPDVQATRALIENLLIEKQSEWTDILAYQNIYGVAQVSDLAAIAARPDVVWVGERFERELMDEKQDQIMAGHFNPGQTGPSAPGYLYWLTNTIGVSTNPADYPIVDITDDGIGNGTVNSGDETMHQFGNIANSTRLAYVSNCTNSASGEGVDGHGHINTSIVGSYDNRSGFPFKDPQGFLRGLGVNPFGRMAGTRIFDPGFDQSSCGSSDTGVIKHVQDLGAQINTNSWGCSSCASTYDDSSQAYDVGVRDADLTEAGNQQLIIFFSAGNSGSGSGTIGTPGNGKNMITVGASENDRPSDEDGSWTDGCNIGPTGADNAMDIISFSSRGPAPGGRVKPEIIAPGTHIQGTASTNSGYTGNGVCDQYRPSGQTEFAASSGTSHSTPASAGVGSLYYYWLQTEHGLTPSPAMMKAYLIAHPTYLTGVSANDTLPSNNQGYGMPNMELGFDSTGRYLLDQTHLFDNTGETWTYRGRVQDPSKPVRIVMAYTDKAGAIGTSPEVNNLNLEAVVGGSTFLGNEFSGQWSVTGGTPDADNNYEAIFLPAGASGLIDITVTAFNIADDGVPNTGDTTDQDFALVVYNIAPPVGLGWLDGIVYDATGAPATDPIAGAAVLAQGNIITNTGSDASDANGYYRMGVLSDTLVVTATMFAYQQTVITNVHVVSGTTTTLDLPLNPATWYTVEGVVTDTNTGWPLFASVDVGGYPGGLTVWTDPVSGYYSVTLPEGYVFDLTVSAWVGGYLDANRSIGPLTGNATENFALEVDAVACNAPGYDPGGGTGSFYDFEANNGGFVGANDWEWGVYSWAGTCETSYPPPSAHSGAHMWGTVLNGCYNNLGATSVLSFSADLTGLTSSMLQWWDWYDVFETFDHSEVYVNGAQVYDRATTYVIPTAWEQHSVDLTPYVGGVVTIEFRMYATAVVERAGWYIDDVLVGEPGCTFPTGGLVVGNVYDANTNIPLNGANVENEDGFAATTVAAPGLAGDGFYALYSPAGSKVFTATLAGYGPATQTPTVLAGDTIRQDFDLGIGQPAVEPATLHAVVGLGLSNTLQLTVSNLGNASFTYEFEERDDGFVPISLLAGGGPDPFGYTYRDSNEAGGPVYNWIDITTTGTPLGLADDGEASVTLPFAFNYYDTDSTALRVGNNGALVFNATTGDVGNTNAALGGSGSNNFIAPFWDDIDADTGNVYYHTLGSAPNRTFVVEWYNRPHYSNVGSATFEVILFEGSNRILFQYQDVVFGNASYDYGATATVGIQQLSPNYLQYSFNTPSLSDNLAIMFYPPEVPWLFESPITGTVGVSGSVVVDVVFDASVPEVTQPGDYLATLLLTSDTVYEPLEIPVTMTVVTFPAVAINEIRIDQTGTDNDEYFELAGAAGASLDDLTYLVIGDGTGGSGVIEAVVNLTGSTIPTGGHFLAAESTLSSTFGIPDLVTSLNFENSDNVTHLLVGGFTGSNNQDLDTNDDGVLDITPWVQQLDLIAVIGPWTIPITTEHHYGPPTVGPDGDFSPGHVFLCSIGWQIGQFNPVGGDDTPGVANNNCPTVGVLLEPAADTHAGDPGQALAYTLRLTNTGSLTDTFDVTNTGNIWAVQLPTDVFTLAAGAGADLAVQVTVDPNAQAGDSDVANITATSRAYSSQAATSVLTSWVLSYTLTADTVGNGAVIKDPDQAGYVLGQMVTLTAAPDPGWAFASWSGSLGTDNPVTLTITGDTVVTATFEVLTYTLDLVEVGNGAAFKDPDQPSYLYGDVVTLTATAGFGWTFAGWSGGLGTVSPVQVTIMSNMIVTATFTQDEYTLDVNTVGNGSVDVDPDQAAYLYGEVVTLTATADAGWHFAGWSGDVVDTANVVTLTMDGDKVVTATFTQDEFTLDVNTVGNGSVDVDPEQTSYVYGDVVTLTATPGSGWYFAGWSGDLGGLVNPQLLTIDGDKAVTATFTAEPPPTYTLDVTIVGSGTVTLDPPGGVYVSSTVVTLTATPDSGWHFAGWSGDLGGLVNPQSLTMDGDKVVTATFTAEPPPTYTLTVVITPTGAGSVEQSSSGPYLPGTVVTLTATPTTGWQFVGWSGDLTGTTNPDSLVMDGNKTVTALFEPVTITYKLFLPIVMRNY